MNSNKTDINSPYQVLILKKIPIQVNCDLSIYYNTEKLQEYLEENEYITDEDMVLYFYDGKLLKDNTDISCFTRPIVCYFITEDNNIYPIQYVSFNSFLDTLININDIVQFDINNAQNGNNISNQNNYNEHINTMRQMGFENDELINISLTLGSGDLERAVNYYLSFMNI